MLSATFKLKIFGLLKIPLLFAVNPKVRTLNAQVCEVEIGLNYFTKNHLGSMYFGALAIGADAVVAIHALNIAEKFKEKAKIVPVFKSLEADFLRRAETDVIFSCEEGAAIEAMVNEALKTGERVTGPIGVKAYSKSDSSEVFATFTLGLSLKAKPKK